MLANEGIPLAVLERIDTGRIHESCVNGDPDDACPNCTQQVMLAFDAVYGHLPGPASVATQVNIDLSRDYG